MTIFVSILVTICSGKEFNDDMNILYYYFIADASDVLRTTTRSLYTAKAKQCVIVISRCRNILRIHIYICIRGILNYISTLNYRL